MLCNHSFDFLQLDLSYVSPFIRVDQTIHSGYNDVEFGSSVFFRHIVFWNHQVALLLLIEILGALGGCRRSEYH